MEVILLEKVYRLGNLGDKVKVKPGYGRNYLIPSRKAVPATPINLAKFETARADLLGAQARALAEAEARAASLSNLTVTIAGKAGSEGKLFGSVGTVDIAYAAAQTGADITKKEVRLPGGPLREVGEHRVDVHLHPDVNIAIKVIIVPAEDGPQSA